MIDCSDSHCEWGIQLIVQCQAEFETEISGMGLAAEICSMFKIPSDSFYSKNFYHPFSRVIRIATYLP